MRYAAMFLAVMICVAVAYAVAFESDEDRSTMTVQDNPKAKPKKFTGRPVFIDDSNSIIVVQSIKNRSLQLVIPGNVEIVKNGMEVPASALDKKSNCVVTYRKQSKLLICLRIDQDTTGK